MRQSCAVAFVACLALIVGCGGKPEPTGPAPLPDQNSKGGPPGGKMTVDNAYRIVQEQMTYTHVNQMFGSTGEGTNDEKPGLMPGNKYVWKEDGKKVYASFGLDGKANGVAIEGFGGK